MYQLCLFCLRCAGQQWTGWKLHEWQDRWRYLSLWLTFFEKTYTYHTIQFSSADKSDGTDEEWTTQRYFSLLGGRETGGRREGCTLCLQADGFLSLKEECGRKHTKGGHTTSSAFFSVAWLFYSLEPLWGHSWALWLCSEWLLESWENRTVDTDTVRQQDANTHVRNKTALTTSLKQAEK